MIHVTAFQYSNHVQVMAISNLIATEFDGKRDLSGIGGVETGADAAEFLLLGANSVQVEQLLHISQHSISFPPSVFTFLLLHWSTSPLALQDRFLFPAFCLQEECLVRCFEGPLARP